jgi:hypothetical protein
MAKADFKINVSIGSGKLVNIGTISVPLLLEKDGMTVELDPQAADEALAGLFEEAAKYLRGKHAEPS